MGGNLFHSLTFGKNQTDGNILCAPLAGYTDIAFRELAISSGASMCYTEMVSCEALVRDNKNTFSLLTRGKNEELYGIQIFTSSPEAAGAAARILEAWNPAVIDINCGCPVPKVIKNGAGAALMKNPELIGRLVAAVKAATDIPVSIKIRTGWDHNSYTFLEAALRAQEAGAACVTMHGRTRSQAYGGTADWEKIAELKAALDIPVIGNGDIFSAHAARKMLEETGCDGIMVARGGIGNPFLFKEIRSLLTDGTELLAPTAEERIHTALAHLERSLETKPERTAIKEMKKQLCAYSKGISGSAAFRNRLVHCESAQEYREYFGDFLHELGTLQD